MKSAIINVRIIDTKNNIDEIGGILINDKGLIEACGRKLQKIMLEILKFMIVKIN